ncbi:MAG TPA: glycogen debranching N-terminal domain-containing protein [Nitrolancea sp.]|nr:glycogen debranching N-terminal domain-containing protein [Nitrolancea sp.]
MQATMVMKAGDVFVLTDERGEIDEDVLGAGLYFRDTRFLSEFRMSLNGRSLILLDSSTEHNAAGVTQFTNELLSSAHGEILPHTIGVRRLREVERGLRERVEVHNFNDFPVTLELDLVFGADFRDIFDIRGFRPSGRGQLMLPGQEGNDAILRYLARDNTVYRTHLHFNRLPDDAWVDASEEIPPPSGELETILPGFDRLVRRHHARPLAVLTLRFRLELGPHALDRLEYLLTPTVQPGPGQPLIEPAFAFPVDEPGERPERFTAPATSNDLVNRALDRSLRDIRTLITPFPDGRLIAAGIPWYSAPFGRDSLIAALQLLLFSPEIAVETLRYLGRQQGTRVNDWTEEEPGKILHEQRFGEMARLGEVPHIPYYGTVDATPLYVILFVELMRWNGDRALFDELYPCVERAIHWIDAFGDSDGDGFVDYGVRSREGLVNQSWKDSDNSLQFPDGTPVIAPIAAVEVQGYVYHAKRGLAEVLERFGAGALSARAAELRRQAEDLRARFEERFWLPDAGF